MKLSNKSRYAMQAMFDLAYHTEGRAAQIKDICERQGIPGRFLEQVFHDLKRAGLVRSKRGPRGGYELTRAPEDVRLGDIVRATEGPITLGSIEGKPHGAGHDVLRETLAKLSREVEACFDDVSLAELCASAEQEGVSRSPSRYVYAI
jgi:Rrf2 family transcriptional regulator, iron-sulfur cluster assembly transcription factor